VYGEGKVGTLEGLIYEFDLVDSLPALSGKLVEVWGMDFGFVNDETAIVKVIADPRKREAWVQEMCYERAMLNRHIAGKLQECGLDSRTPIYADCAEPKSIAEIKEAGFNVIPCSKDAPVRSEKLKFQIQWMQGWQLHFTKDSLNLIKEGRNYVWEKDKDGNITNCPIDVYNHALDALRYATFTRFGQNAGYGQYRISIR
jgi:phage terminase large subunit